ncbi:TPA: AAA family ATPase [Bacillus mycoides]|uniref:AAA family ATPase n=1 Tax=Bacillus sp. FSL P2-0099 TaxID=2921572 RepID=UPI0030F7B454|nr:AAA family ATPase [Bacillus mycoides]
MFIRYLYIKQYKKLKNLEIVFGGNRDFRKEFKEFYGDMNFTVLVGENGVGKTTTMSFIASIFHNLERFHSRIPSDFQLHCPASIVLYRE